MSDEDAQLSDFASASEDGAADDPASDEGTADDPPSDGTPDDDGPTPDDGDPSAARGPPGDGAAGETPDDGADPAVPTAAWRPGGACDACGDPAERRWRDDGAFVCPDCKEW